MAKTRSELRELAMIILYQINLYENNKITYQVEQVINDNVQIENEFIKEIVFGVITYQSEIDQKANHFLKDWTLDRLGLPDQAIIRLSIYELLYTKTPEIVIINEAIELAKKYSDEKVRQMINGILDKIYHEK